jgi:RepB plasmid partitioning protein
MKHRPVKIGFERQVLEIPLEDLIALKEKASPAAVGRKYKQIRASLEHIGLIEPLSVYPQSGGKYLVVNGNLRLHLMRELCIATARCTIALDDEAYTYNKRVNSLSPIAEHYMILKAVANGVTEARIASGLSVDVEAIRRRRSLLDGICAEVVQLLHEKRISQSTFTSLRKMKPLRQIEAAELMISASNYSSPFAAAILSVTQAESLVHPPKTPTKAHSPAASTLIEESTETLLRELAVVRRTYGADVLSLTVICRSIEAFMGNPAIERYLTQNHPEILAELRRLLLDVNEDRTGANDTRKPPQSTGRKDAAVAQAIQ